MSVPGLLVRYFGIYVGLMLGMAAVFNLIGVKANAGLNTGALIGAVLGACLWFSRSNQRYLRPNEKWAAVAGMWALDLLVQVVMAFAIAAATQSNMPPGPLLMVVGFVSLLHGAAILVMVWFAGRQYAKQVTRRA
jgi:hypothetical protein